jgi:hypothetical protein
MSVRLFKLGQRARPLALALGTLNLLALSGACGGKEFIAHGSQSLAGSGGGGGSGIGNESGGVGAIGGGEAGESGSAEAGSGAPSGGSGGDAPSAGSGGKPAVGCDCAAGEYCQDGTVKCRKCADFSRLEFATAQKLTTLAQSPQSIERFPRSAGSSSALFYVSGAADNAKVLYAAAPVSGVGTPVSTGLRVESGPLYVGGFAEQNLFFDRQQPGGRKLMMALWTAPALITKEAPVPGLINVAGSEDYSIAISPNTGHVYWMSNRNGGAELLWQPTSMSAPPAPAVLDLKVKAGAAECPRAGEDATPWVNVLGTLLLFRNPSVGDSCEPNDSGATDLFAAPLNKDGIPPVAATPLSSINNTGGLSWETDPSLSPDSCAIYFASDDGTGDFDLYKAQRN